MENISKNDKILIGVALLIAILFGYYLLVLKPIYTKIEVENQTILGYNSEIMTLNSLAIKNKKDQSDLNTLEAKVSTMALQLPQVEKSPQLAFDIKNSADNYGLSIKDINFTPPTQYSLAPAASTGANSSASTSSTSTNQAPNAATTKANQLIFAKLQVVPVKITISGNYTKIMDFIQAIETGKRIAVIKSVDLTVGQSSSTPATTITSINSSTKGITTTAVFAKQGNTKNIILLNDLEPSTGTNNTNAATNSNGSSTNAGGGEASTPGSAATNTNAANTNNTTVPVAPVVPTYEVQAAIEINYYYVLSDTNIGQYNFNNGTYGKTDVFK